MCIIYEPRVLRYEFLWSTFLLDQNVWPLCFLTPYQTSFYSRSSQTSDIIGWISKPSQYIIVFLARVFMFKLKFFFTFIRELENPPLIFAKEPTSNHLKRLRNGIYGRVKFPLSLQYVFGWTMSVPELWKSCNHESWNFQHLLFDYSQIFIWSMRWFQFLINDCLMNTLSNGRRQSGRFKRHMCLHVCLLRPPPPLARSRGGRQFFHRYRIKLWDSAKFI